MLYEDKMWYINMRPKCYINNVNLLLIFYSVAFPFSFFLLSWHKRNLLLPCMFLFISRFMVVQTVKGHDTQVKTICNWSWNHLAESNERKHNTATHVLKYVVMDFLFLSWKVLHNLVRAMTITIKPSPAPTIFLVEGYWMVLQSIVIFFYKRLTCKGKYEACYFQVST